MIAPASSTSTATAAAMTGARRLRADRRPGQIPEDHRAAGDRSAAAGHRSRGREPGHPAAAASRRGRCPARIRRTATAGPPAAPPRVPLLVRGLVGRPAAARRRVGRSPAGSACRRPRTAPSRARCPARCRRSILPGGRGRVIGRGRSGRGVGPGLVPPSECRGGGECADGGRLGRRVRRGGQSEQLGRCRRLTGARPGRRPAGRRLRRTFGLAVRTRRRGRRAQGDRVLGVRVDERRPAERLGDHLGDQRDPGGAADQQHGAERRPGRPAPSAAYPVERADRRLDRRADHALELGAREPDVEVPVGQEHRDGGLGVDRQRLLGQRRSPGAAGPGRCRSAGRSGPARSARRRRCS